MARSEKKSENATAPIKPPLTIETITLKKALQILKYPKILGVNGKKNVELKTGKHGFYVCCGKESANIPADIDPDEITVELALEYITDKQKQHEEKMNKYLYYHKEGNIEYIINTGKYGENNRYLMIKDTSKKTAKPLFLSFPPDEGLEEITIERVKELAEEAKAKKWKRKAKTDDDNASTGSGKKRATAKKAGAKAATAKATAKTTTKTAKATTAKASGRAATAKASGRATVKTTTRVTKITK